MKQGVSQGICMIYMIWNMPVSNYCAMYGVTEKLLLFKYEETLTYLYSLWNHTDT